MKRGGARVMAAVRRAGTGSKPPLLFFSLFLYKKYRLTFFSARIMIVKYFTAFFQKEQKGKYEESF
jgi:hypothetical protein